jgi:uncharacterized membrane protein
MANIFSTTVQFALSMAMLLFLPGFALTYWLKLIVQIDLLERIFLSILLSLCVTVFVAYSLSSSSAGLNPTLLMLIVAGGSFLLIFLFFFYLMLSGRALEIMQGDPQPLATPIWLLSYALFFMLILGAFSYLNAELVVEHREDSSGAMSLPTAVQRDD